MATPATESRTARPARIRADKDGVAWIAGANTKVVEVVLDKLAYGWSPEEMHWQHPHLSLAQIHAALSYYYDHQQEIDEQIEQDDREVEEMRRKAGPSPIVKKLRVMGKLK